MLRYIVTAIKISSKKVLIYPFEVWMLLIHSIFELLFILLFWWSITSHFVLAKGYSTANMFVFSALVMIASGFTEIFFGVNILPYDINGGGLDLYLIKPGNTWVRYILDHLNFPIVVEKIGIGSIVLVFSLNNSTNEYTVTTVFIVVGLLFLASIIFGLLDLLISFIAFWTGDIHNFKNMIYSINDIKKYPLNFFANRYKQFFLTIIPIGFITYYPFEILIGNVQFTLEIFTSYIFFLVVLFLLIRIVSKKGLRVYASNN